MNAKQEFIQFVKDKPIIEAAIIQLDDYYDGDNSERILKVGYSDYDYLMFLNSIDIDYDSGYGGQYLFGTIWFEGSTWASRGEYDGSEWWEYNKRPEIPESLR